MMKEDGLLRGPHVNSSSAVFDEAVGANLPPVRTRGTISNNSKVCKKSVYQIHIFCLFVCLFV